MIKVKLFEFFIIFKIPIIILNTLGYFYTVILNCLKNKKTLFILAWSQELLSVIFILNFLNTIKLISFFFFCIDSRRIKHVIIIEVATLV